MVHIILYLACVGKGVLESNGPLAIRKHASPIFPPAKYAANLSGIGYRVADVHRKSGCFIFRLDNRYDFRLIGTSDTLMCPLVLSSYRRGVSWLQMLRTWQGNKDKITTDQHVPRYRAKMCCGDKHANCLSPEPKQTQKERTPQLISHQGRK